MDPTFPGSDPDGILDPDELRAARRAVRDTIVQMLYGPGDFIDARKLSRKLKLSPLVIQDALYRLGEQGLVNAPDQWGAYVASPSKNELKEIDELRIQLEAIAVKRFAQRATNAQMESLRRCMEALEFAVMTQQGPSVVLEFRDTFFRIILRGAHCPSTAAVLLRLRKRMELVLTVVAANDETARGLVLDLREQYEALHARDVPRAIAAAESHIRRSSGSANDLAVTVQ